MQPGGVGWASFTKCWTAPAEHQPFAADSQAHKAHAKGSAGLRGKRHDPATRCTQSSPGMLSALFCWLEAASPAKVS